MGLHHRKLLSDSVCENYCRSEQPCAADKDCVDACHREVCNNIPVPPPPPVDHTKHNNTSTYLIISFSIAATVFLVLFCYVIYDKFFSSSNRSRRRDSLTEDDFIDEEHGPTVDHPIWYIRTPGLQQSIINAITVCKYNKGDGLIEGTDCSVCLTEFQQDENLRLLPKCNHAFHLPCIDIWLTSHTNCPLCRAPIVTDPLRVPSMNPNVLGSSTFESARMEFSENSVANGEEEEGEEVEEDGRRVCEAAESSALNMQPRRSVSLDSSSAAKINLALSTVVLSVESHHGNSDRQQVGEVSEQIVSKRVAGNGNLVNLLHSAPSSMKRSRSFNGKHLLSWYSRSQKKSNGPVRSF